MAPNRTTSEINSAPCSEQETEKKHLEILYNGYFYDVTNFIRRHPGGNVIKFYTEFGEDATQAIGQFHFRSMDKVDAILKSLKRRPAEQHKCGFELKTLSRNEALSTDFKMLAEQLKMEGYFEPSIRHVIIRLVEAVALPLLAYGIFFQCETVLGKFFSAIFIGFAHSRFGWIQHEGGHNSLTGRPKIDKIIQRLFLCLPLGGSTSWWNSQHNRHHAMPQRLEHDVDLHTLPYVAFHKRTVKDMNEINSFFVKYQAVLYWTLDSSLVLIMWRLFLHPRYQLHKRLYFEFMLGIPSLLFSMFVLGPFWYIWVSYWFAFFMGVNFALSHSHLEVADKPTHWVEYSLTHTANIQPSMFVDYFMGYLNYQIEHHLFPTMPQFRQKQICHRVKALAEKHGLPYRVYSYTEACILAVKNLNDVGQELTRKKE